MVPLLGATEWKTNPSPIVTQNLKNKTRFESSVKDKGKNAYGWLRSYTAWLEKTTTTSILKMIDGQSRIKYF